MKFTKILLVCAALVTLGFAEEVKSEKPKSEETKEEKVDIKEEATKAFKEPKIDSGHRTKEQCEQGYQLLQSVYSDIEKDPKCTYNKEYAEEHGYDGDYTMVLDNRDYFCSSCLTKYLKLGNPMVNACGSNAPNEMVYDMYFLSAVNSIICTKDKLSDKYCEVVIDELFAKEDYKPIINWKEDTLCGECPYYYHNIFKEREEFYNSVLKDSADNSFIGRLLPLRDVEIDCFKEFDFHREQAMKDAKKNKGETKNINYNQILEELKKNEQALKEKEAQEEKEKKEKEEKVEEVEDKEDSTPNEKEKTEEKAEEKAEEKPKKASEAGEL